jgi:hypothetical protein
MQDLVFVKDVQKLTGRVVRLTDSFLGLQKEACRSFKFSEVLRIFSGPKVRTKLSRN